MLRASFAAYERNTEGNLMLLRHTEETRRGKFYVIAAYGRDRKEYGI